MVRILVIFVVVFYDVLFAPFVQADEAELFIISSGESHVVGETITVSIKLSSDTQVNAIEGRLQFSNEKVEIVQILKTESIVELWVEGPSFSNKQGVIRFSGGIPKFGFIGDDAKLFDIVFRIIDSGPAKVTWSFGQVLRADGTGTNILSNTINTDFNFYSPGFFDKIERYAMISGTSPITMTILHLTILIVVLIMICLIIVLYRKIST